MQTSEVVNTVSPALRIHGINQRTEHLNADIRALEIQLAELYSTPTKARTFPVVGTIAQGYSQLIQNLHLWQRLDKDEPREVVLNVDCAWGEAYNMGGGIVHDFNATNALIDAIRRFQERGHRVVVQVAGTAGYHTVALMQVADERIITPNSWVMLGEFQRMPTRQNTSEVRDKIKYFKELEAQTNGLILGRSNVAAELLGEKTEHDQKWHISAAEAVELGFADRVGVHTADAVSLPDYPAEFLASDGDEPQDAMFKAELRRNFLRSVMAKAELATIEAGNANPRELYFFGEVTEESCANAIMHLQKFARTPNPDLEIDMYMNSPGGSVKSGLALMDVMEQVKAGGAKINVIILGQAASMGGFITQAATRRVMGKHARFLIHRISSIFHGTSSQMDEQEEHTLDLEERAMPLLAARSNMSVDEIKEKSDKHDWWLSAEEAQELGFVDEIL